MSWTTTADKRTRRGARLITSGAVTCMLALAACASASSVPTGSSGSQLALSHCMRAHGVSNFPDPSRGPGGEGFSISESVAGGPLTVDGISFSGPAFTAAEKTCKLFGGGTAPPPVSESQKLAMFHFAQCMREHGVPSYPDPSFAPGGRGVNRNLPSGLNTNAPAFQHAAASCNAT